MTISFDNQRQLPCYLKFTRPFFAKHIFTYSPRVAQLRVDCITEVIQCIGALSNVLSSVQITGQMQPVTQFITHAVNVAAPYFEDAAGFSR